MSAPKVTRSYGGGTAAAPPSEPLAGPTRVRQRRAADELHGDLDEAARLRLGLQRRATINFRRHFQRALLRFSVLLGADLATFTLMRAVLRGIRDRGWFGGWAASRLGEIVPSGNLDGFQYASALLVGLLVVGTYGEGDKRRDARGLFMACALATALPLWMEIWNNGLEQSASRYAFLLLVSWVCLVAERFTVDRLVSLVRNPKKHAARTLFVGPHAECRTAAETKLFSDSFEFQPIGFVDINEPPAKGALGGIDQLGAVMQRERAEVVVMCGQLEEDVVDPVVDAALIAGCRLISMPRALTRTGVTPSLVWRQGEVVVELTAPTLRGQYLVAKRAMDIVVSLVSLLVISPVLVLLAVLVKLDSDGPAIFAQSRVGQGGRVFRIYKFRTMSRDAEQQRAALASSSIYKDARLFKIEKDPRLTRLGAWLRRTSLDELPQLWNVLKGDMSLVGPRPPLPSEVALYEVHHYARFDVRPGITGPWQVSGRNQITDFEAIVRLETDYIRQWSVLRDLVIMLRTVPVVLAMRGAH